MSEDRNRERITLLKSDYREILSLYKNDEEGFKIIKTPLELQFENADKLFLAFENLMEKNEYTEVSKVVRAIDTMIANLKIVIEETRPIVSLGHNLIPKKMEEVELEERKLSNDGFNLDYLNIEYNKEEANKKIIDIFQKLNVLNVDDSLFELKTIFDYFDSLLSDFDKEKLAKKVFQDYMTSLVLKCGKLEKINNELIRKIDDIKYNYNLENDETSVLFELKEELINIRDKYDKTVELYRSKKTPFSKLTKNMEEVKYDLSKTEEKLNVTLRILSSLKEDEQRAREQLDEIKKILFSTKEKIKSYKLPIIPRNYYVELSEAMEAIDDMNKELDKRPLTMHVINLRVDTARDLVLKVFNTVNENIKTARMAETAIIYGNRYRPVNKEVDFNLIKAENAFNKGNFKISLENAINAINIIEPGIHNKLLEEYKK